jgi:hypothetical protein
MSSEEFTTNQDVSTSEDNPLIIEINRNIGKSTDEDAVVMPKNVNQEEVKPIENLPEEKTDNQSIEEKTDDIFSGASAGSPQEIISQTITTAKAPKPITPKTQIIFETIQGFNPDVRPYVTAKDAEEIVNSNFDNITLQNVTDKIYQRKQKDIESFASEGRNINLVGDALDTYKN